MAIFYYNISVGSLKSGGAQQRGRYVRRDPRQPTDETHDVTSFSINITKWADGDSDKFWATCDAMERTNGIVFREHELALPNELTREQNEALSREFVANEFSPFVTESGIHWKPQNAHLHSLSCERILDGIERHRGAFFKRYNAKNPSKGGCRKSTRFSGGEFSDRAQQKLNVKAIRESWAKLCNEHLARHGHSARIDHRSNEARGIAAPAGVHLDKSALGFEKRGMASRRRDYAIVLKERRRHVINLKLGEIAERDQRNFEKSIDQKSNPIDNNKTENNEQVADELDQGSRSLPPAGFSHVEALQHRNNGWVDNVPCFLGVRRVHQAGYQFPAYFSVSRPRGSAPIAIQR